MSKLVSRRNKTRQTTSLYFPFPVYRVGVSVAPHDDIDFPGLMAGVIVLLRKCPTVF